MAHKFWTRRAAMCDAPPLKGWPGVKDDALVSQQAERFRARKKAIEMYAEGFPLDEVMAATGIDKTRLPRLLRGCLALADDGQIQGFRSLIPGVRQKLYERTAPEKPKLPQAKGGKSGLFQATLRRFPELEKELVDLILKKPRRGITHEKKIRAVDLHQFFLARLSKLGVTKNEWPFRTQHLGRRSVFKYMKAIKDEHFAAAVMAREEEPARAHLATGKGIPPLITFEEPFGAVELDAHRIHAFFSVLFNTPEGTQVRVQLERLWLLAMVEHSSSAVLAYEVVYSSEVSADDVVRLIGKAAGGTWKPMELTIPGLEYHPDGGLPSGVIPQCQGALWSVLFLDGALVHLSDAVRELSRKRLGFAINWGPVAHFERRPNIERLFKSIEDDLFMRSPSTTGSNPGRGRAKNAEQNAIIYNIDAAENEQLLDVTIANHNAKPTSGMSYMSSLEYLRYYVEEKGDHFMVRHLPEGRRNEVVIPQKTTCTVCGGRKSGRRPYIELDGAHYTNPVLAEAGELIGKKLLVEINEDDYRHVRAFLENGAEIGVLTAQGRWGLTKHSRKTRKQINRLITSRTLKLSEFADPVQVYMRHLSTLKVESKAGRKKKPQISPRDATTAARVAKESNLPLEIPESLSKAEIPPLSESADSAIGRPMPDLNALLNRLGK